MNKRFVDNKTPLNAETLNKLEEDLKAFSANSMPVYHAVYEENTNNSYKVYRISEVAWKNIPLGSHFGIVFDQSTQGTTNKAIALKFGPEDGNIYYIFYNLLDMPIVFPYAQTLKVDNRKYLLTNETYVFKKLAENNFSSPMICLMDQMDTSTFGSALSIDDGVIQLKNLDKKVISSISLPMQVANQTTVGGVKIWISGTTLNISTT